MKKKIQITASVKEDNKIVEYETGKYDSISSAEKDLLNMMDNTQSTSDVKDVKLVAASYNVVECFKDEYNSYKYSQDEMI